MRRYFKFLYFFIFIGMTFMPIEIPSINAAVKKNTANTKKNTNNVRGANSQRKTNTKNNQNNKNTGKKGSPAPKKVTPKQEQKLPGEIVHNDSLTLMVNTGVLEWLPSNLNPGGLRVNWVNANDGSKTAKIYLNENFTYLPVTKELIKDISEQARKSLPESIRHYDVTLLVRDKPLSYFINKIDKLPESARTNPPFVVETDPLVKAKEGMSGDIVAMWASHGRYYKNGVDGWLWQRPQLFQVAEDTHTMSYIYPYVVPMIENAGGYVLMPRERNINSNEVIVDNDTNEGGMIYSQPFYKESTGKEKWVFGEEEGFIYDLPNFRDTENPFENGTYRQTKTITNGKASIAAWCADIPEDGEYAVYVSYKTLPNSTDDARYTVNYSGGSKEFRVNQTMGGGTWVYLGTFHLEAGFSDEEPVVVLTNKSSKAGKILTADAVKIGGGMGNIERSSRRSDVYNDPSTPLATDIEYVSGIEDDGSEEAEAALAEFQAQVEASKNSGNKARFTTSGMPRWLEGARYWLHWAGFPEYIYSPNHGNDDYKDDYTCRGLWVNYLAGGSRVLPGQKGLNIPVDLSMALHSDAGKRDNDSFIGTLGIYFTNNGAFYKDGTPRSISRTLTDMLMRQITMDIRQTWEPNWTRRSMWDKSYLEAKTPEVPASLIEFMSHQNFADMKYALDPAFRFTVGRSIYKAIGRFIAERKDRKFIVQPLPVKNFAITRVKSGTYKLEWEPTMDKLEPTADPTKYIIMERTGDDLGFHKIGETSNRSFTLKINDKNIHSFQIIAANDGGLSFPSETLALREGDDNPVLIINGFTRVSAPENRSNSSEAGFYTGEDFGVPYIKDISFIGYQTEFRRSAGENLGKSNGDYATKVIAGNTFDFPFIHGKAISNSGRGFVSTSVGAVDNGSVDLKKYQTVDLILGKQKATITGFGSSGVRDIAFPESLQKKLRQYVNNGGDLLVTGTYVSTDLFGPNSPSGSQSFAREVLGIDQGRGSSSKSGRITSTDKGFNVKNIDYSNSLNEKDYIVQNPDELFPVNDSRAIYQYSDTGATAAVLGKKGKGTVIVSAIPFEVIDTNQRDNVMKVFLNNLAQ